MPSMRAGSYHDGELWLRCPYCGDSETHLGKAHFSVNNSGIWHCFRCSRGGKLSISKLINLYTRAGVLDQVLRADLDIDPEKWEGLFEQLLPGPATRRNSELDRFHHQGNDVFLSRKADGELVGLALAIGRKRRVVGHREFGFKGEQLESSPKDPLRLVEGPYDVIGPRDVCVFGLITHKHIKKLRGHYLILCPDGDVWTEEKKLNGLLRAVSSTNHSWGASIVCIEKLRYDEDPDKVPYEDRQRLTQVKVIELYGG